MSLFYTEFRERLLQILVGLTHLCEPRNWNYSAPEVTKQTIRNCAKLLNEIVAEIDEKDRKIEQDLPEPIDGR